jgi:hypothetical protein
MFGLGGWHGRAFNRRSLLAATGVAVLSGRLPGTAQAERSRRRAITTSIAQCSHFRHSPPGSWQSHRPGLGARRSSGLVGDGADDRRGSSGSEGDHGSEVRLFARLFFSRTSRRRIGRHRVRVLRVPGVTGVPCQGARLSSSASAVAPAWGDRNSERFRAFSYDKHLRRQSDRDHHRDRCGRCCEPRADNPRDPDQRNPRQ